MRKLSLYIILCSIFLVGNVEAKTNTITNIQDAKKSSAQILPIQGKTEFEKEIGKLSTNEEKNEFMKKRTANFTVSKRICN